MNSWRVLGPRAPLYMSEGSVVDVDVHLGMQRGSGKPRTDSGRVVGNPEADPLHFLDTTPPLALNLYSQPITSEVRSALRSIIKKSLSLLPVSVLALLTPNASAQHPGPYKPSSPSSCHPSSPSSGSNSTSSSRSSSTPAPATKAL